MKLLSMCSIHFSFSFYQNNENWCLPFFPPFFFPLQKYTYFLNFSYKRKSVICYVKDYKNPKRVAFMAEKEK